MFLNLTPGRGLDDNVMRTLEETLAGLENVNGGGGTAETRRRNYLGWAAQAASRLRGVLTAEQLATLVLTERYRALLIVALGDQELNGLLDLEIGDRLAAWRHLVDKTKTWRTRWATAGVVVVPDTNVFLQHDDMFDVIPWHKIVNQPPFNQIHLVVPLLIVDELDRQKRNGKTEARTRARATLKRFNELLRAGPDRVALQTAAAPTGVTLEVLVDELDHQRLTDNDNEIVAQTRLLADLVPIPVHLITADTGMALRARNIGLRVTHLDL